MVLTKGSMAKLRSQSGAARSLRERTMTTKSTPRVTRLRRLGK